MARLYWRVKRDGKWTWIPVQVPENRSMKEIISEMIDFEMILPLEGNE